MSRIHGVRLLTAAVLFAGFSREALAQLTDEHARRADSARTAIDAASSREDWSALQDAAALSQRLLTSAPDDGLLLHYRGYALFRLALVASRRDDPVLRRRLLDDADQTLRASAASLPLAETHALRASILGQMIGLSGNPFVSMRLGPRSSVEMKQALELAPDNPRVWLIRGINTMHTPRMFGGGLDAAEEYLTKARVLFASDTAHPPRPTWGKADVEIALGQLHLMQLRYMEARADFGRALLLQPRNGWVRDTLLVEATRER
jgi:tetratricopeptide (TPR) repeat protein